MKEEYGYMDDEELEALIAEVENGGMIAPPIYLKELIMEAISREADAGEEGRELSAADGGHGAAETESMPRAEMEGIVRMPRAEMEGTVRIPRAETEETVQMPRAEMEETVRAAKAVRKAKAQFLGYSFKIVAAAAVAVFCLTMIPVDFHGGGMMESGRIEQRIEKDAKKYQEEKEKALAEEENIGGEHMGFFDGRLGLDSSKSVDRILNGFSKWFGMEEEIYD